MKMSRPVKHGSGHGGSGSGGVMVSSWWFCVSLRFVLSFLWKKETKLNL